jgi:GT2 family glycosyltransferase
MRAPVRPEIGVVILTHNRAAEALRTVRHMSALSEQPRLVVVDNASVDDTAEIMARSFPYVDVIRLEKNIGAAARNVGARSIGTPYIAFCDDDTVWAAGSLARACELLDAYPGVAALTARVLVGAEERDDPVCAVMASSPLPSTALPGRAVLGFLAGACVFRRAAFLETGGYDPRFLIGGEEALLALDLAAHGDAVVYAKELIVHHYPSHQRDPALRQRHMVRNALWVAWLRRPLRSALARTVAILGSAPDSGASLPGLVDAARGLPWVLRDRRVIPPRVEALCALLENGR